MKVTIVSVVFPPEPPMSARTSCDIAEEMASRGHEVTVIAPYPNRPSGILKEGTRRAWKSVETRRNYRVIHCWHTLSKSPTVLSRLMENLSFGITSTLQLINEPRPDVIYMNNWPIFAQWMNSLYAHSRRVPLICAVHDLYPETFSKSKNLSLYKPFCRLLKRMGRQVYQRSSLVTALNSIQREYLIENREVTERKVKVFHDWLEVGRFPVNQSKQGKLRENFGLSDKDFLTMYVGSMTRMAGLEVFIDAAKRLRHRKDIHIFLVGDGAMRQVLQTKIAQEGLQNIRLVPSLDSNDVPEVQANADVLMLSLLPGAAEHTTPSKMIFYMFSQRPVLACVEANSPPARIINEAMCGYVVQQNDADDLAAHIVTLADHRSSLAKMGHNARSYAERNFAKEHVLPRICDLLERVGSKPFCPYKELGLAENV